jgi:hypothetical protein
VTVQLPLYNERHVVERLIDAACALDYPRDRIEIQVLDDSTDDTTGRARARVALHRARGTEVTLIHRRVRHGYKAGALAAGLSRARGQILCLFDADFLPPRDFLLRLMPAFDDPRVGMVQARWGHLNRDYSLLTESQALCLDGHFAIEHAARAANGRFFNFNGTAGLWRRRAIEDAGGWTHDTLTEDLDLSYRAQLKGWKFVYRRDVVAPAELPIDIGAFKAQQRRWARGSLQTARKVLPLIARSRLPLSVKLEAFCHLTANASYLLLFASILLLGPVLLLPSRDPQGVLAGGAALLFASGFAGVVVFFASARRALGESWRDGLACVPGALLLGVGLSLNNARAVAGAFLPRVGGFERTPKFGVRSRGHRLPERSYLKRAGGEGAGESMMVGYALGLGILAIERGRFEALPFVILVAAGFGLVAWLSLVPEPRPSVQRARRAEVRALPADAVKATPI